MSEPREHTTSGEWETATPDEGKFCPVCGAYAIEEEIFRSRDERGQSSLLHVRVPPDVSARLEEMVQSGKFPYRTIQDIMRESLGHRLFYLGKKLKSKSLDDTLVRLRSIHKMLDDEAFQVGFERDIENLKTAVKFKLTHGGDMGKESARALVREMYDRVNGLQNDYYKEVYSEWLVREYQDLIKEKK